MKSDPKIISALNLVLVDMLSSINQYFLHARIYKNIGLEKLNGRVYKESIREMKAADDLITRILFLEGLPNLQDLNKLMIGENPQEILECDNKRVNANLATMRSAIALCESMNDYQTREVIEHFLEDEEEYLDWLETQFHLLKSIGQENYLAEQIS
jgi:bacterioferritin